MNVTRVTMECGRIHVVIFPKISVHPCVRRAPEVFGRSLSVLVARGRVGSIYLPTLIGILIELIQFKTIS